MSLEITPDGIDPLAKLAALTAVEACGHLAEPRNAPPTVIGYAKGFARSVVAIAKTVRTLRTSDPAVVHNALSRIAREGLQGRVEVRLQDYRDDSDGPFDTFGSQWSPTFSCVCFTAALLIALLLNLQRLKNANYENIEL